MEFIARVKALLRRTKVHETLLDYYIGPLYICPSKHTIQVSGNEVTLAKKEYELLLYLVEHQELAISRERLISAIWGYEFVGESRTWDVHIRNLRKKLGVAGGSRETVKGIGYKLRGN